MNRIFLDYGIEINEECGRYYLTFDEGKFSIQMRTIEISKEDAFIAQKNEKSAYNVVIKYQNLENNNK